MRLSETKHRARTVSGMLREVSLAGRLALWLCGLPLRLRVQHLQTILNAAGGVSVRGRATVRDRVTRERRVAIASRVSGLPLFRLKLFPRFCLRRSLALYRALALAGYPVTFCIGVHEKRGVIRAHSWIAVDAQVVGEPDPGAHYQKIFEYPGMPRSRKEASGVDAERGLSRTPLSGSRRMTVAGVHHAE
jgi:hypothetical protein